jgi:hypothetical protein
MTQELKISILVWFLEELMASIVLAALFGSLMFRLLRIKIEDNSYLLGIVNLMIASNVAQVLSVMLLSAIM